jgi:hypothetical protein
MPVRSLPRSRTSHHLRTTMRRRVHRKGGGQQP